MKKKYLFLSFIILIISCSKDDLVQPAEEPPIAEKTVNQINFDQIPEKISDLFDKEYYINIKTSDKIIFGKARTDIPAKINYAGKKITYTIALNKVISTEKVAPTPGLYYDNAVIWENKNGNLKLIVLRYEPTSEWANSTRNLNFYSGSVTFYNSNGIKFGEILMEDGEEILPYLTQKREICVMTFKAKVCTGGLYGYPESCTYTYDSVCTGGGSGDYDVPTDWDYGDPSGGTGSTSPGDSDGGPGDINTNPIIDENGDLIEEEVVLNIYRTSDFTNNEKINCTYERLMDESSIPEALSDFFGDNALYDVTFNVVENLSCRGNINASGCTTPLPGNTYRIDIDLDYINDTTTPTIFLAQTLIHESFHAKLFAEVKNNIDPNVTSTTNFEVLYDKYRQHENWTHEIMAEAYLKMMQKALKEVHPQLNDDQFINNYNQYDPSYLNWEDFYEVLSYRGLKETTKGAEYYQINGLDISKYTEETEANSTKNTNCNE